MSGRLMSHSWPQRRQVSGPIRCGWAITPPQRSPLPTEARRGEWDSSNPGRAAPSVWRQKARAAAGPGRAGWGCGLLTCGHCAGGLASRTRQPLGYGVRPYRLRAGAQEIAPDQPNAGLRSLQHSDGGRALNRHHDAAEKNGRARRPGQGGGRSHKPAAGWTQQQGEEQGLAVACPSRCCRFALAATTERRHSLNTHALGPTKPRKAPK